MNSLGPFRKMRSKDIEASPDIAKAALRSDQFRLEREGEWTRLEYILTRMEKGKIKSISDEDLLALPVLYRTAASSLSVARETSLDRSTLAYLESLVQRAWFQVYGPRTGFFAWLRSFLFGGWSRAVREIWLEICVALFVMVAGAVVGWLLVAQDKEWYYRLVPGRFVDSRVPGASREELMETIAVTPDTGGLSAFAAQLFANNAGVCILAFALGFAFGVPSALLLIYNMAVLGAMLWLFNGQDLLVEFAAWLSVHGTTELFGILLSGAAGMHIGRCMAFPGDDSVMSAMKKAGQRAALVMVGVVIMMVFAAVLEAFPRQLVGGAENRFIIGGSLLVLWIAYFFAYRPRRSNGAEI